MRRRTIYGRQQTVVQCHTPGVCQGELRHMPYYHDADAVSLDDLRIRIKDTDLVPSRSLLLENIEEKFAALNQCGINSLADLRQAVKNAKSSGLLAQRSGIDLAYLTLLRREIESYFPQPAPMQEFGWLDQDQIDILVSLGYKNAALLYAAWEAPQARSEILHTEGLERRFLDEICCLVDLTRIQWVSPLAAKMLFSAGYRDAEAVARADAEQLCAALDAANKDRQYFKGKIGLRDSKRLIKAAAYVASY